MEKLRLDLDRLAVDSFDAGRAEVAPGAANAYGYTNTRPTCVYHCTFQGYTCDYCAR